MLRSRVGRAAEKCTGTVLILDDDDIVRESMAEVVRSYGGQVFEARESAEALRMLDTVARPCLVLLDLVMPSMNGVGFLDCLKAHPRASDFRVLVVSAHPLAHRARALPWVVGTLQKPFEVSVLEQWLDRVFNEQDGSIQ